MLNPLLLELLNALSLWFFIEQEWKPRGVVLSLSFDCPHNSGACGAMTKSLLSVVNNCLNLFSGNQHKPCPKIVTKHLKYEGNNEWTNQKIGFWDFYYNLVKHVS